MNTLQSIFAIPSLKKPIETYFCDKKAVMLTIEPLGGLCNRMRALDSAFALARTLRYPVTILWNIDASLGCRFDKLFYRPEGLHKIVQRDKRARINRLLSRIIEGLKRKNDLFLGQAEVEKHMRQHVDFSHLSRYQTVHIATCSSFYQSDAPFRDFQPVQELQIQIDSYTHFFNNTIGIHIRRTDNRKAIEYSPTEFFLAAIERLAHDDPQATFFLATDEPQEEKRILEAFPGRVIIHKKRSFRRNEAAAIQDALIDLYTLSKCKKIIGSYWSSFSDVARALGNAELILPQ
jgi:hypothetical protein